jgi:succinoglycan biosynthesis transport protein ExoP
MLHINKVSPAALIGQAQSISPTQLISFINGFVRRRLPVLVIVFSVTMVCGFVYLFTAPARYAAKATMIIDTRKVQVFQQQSILGDVAIDSAAIDTQMELVKSDKVALSVIKELHLTEDPEFVGSNSGFLGALLDLVTPRQQKSEFELARRALSVFSRGLSVRRLANTYVIEISFQSLSPDLAAKIANATADAYIVDQLDAKYQATRSAWLQDRIQELRQQASAAERAVLDFKEKNNIVDTGGRLIGDQQLAELNSQLVIARAATAEARARLDRITEITKADVHRVDDVLRKPDAAVADALRNDVITKLRTEYLELANKEGDFSVRLGSNHLVAVNLRNQMLEIRKSIFAELQRIAETFKSDYEIALAREASITASLASTVSASQSTNHAQINLRELESNSQTFRALHDNFLQRYMETVQQQSFPITEARLISPAAPPASKSQPNSLLVIAIAATGGLLFAFGGALLVEFSDRGFRTREQVESLLASDCIAVVPRLDAKQKNPTDIRNVASKILSEVPRTDIRNVAGKILSEVPRRGSPTPLSRSLAPTGLLSAVIDDPFSRFTEAIRAIKVAADLASLDKPIRTLGVTSSLPNEGKSTVAANFANLISHAGGRAILVDCDLRNPSLSRNLTPNAEVGLLEVIARKANLEDVIWTDPRTGLVFLPLVAKTRLTHTNEVLASAGMSNLIARLRSTYEYIVMDLPPLAPVVDVRSTTQIVDSYMFVVEWGRTSVEMAQHVLNSAPQIYDKLLGVTLNKADIESMKNYDRYGGGSYYKQYYERYGLS